MLALRRRWLKLRGASAGQLELELFQDKAQEPGKAQGRIFTIPPAAPFLDTLARAILAGNLPRAGGVPPGPADLADALIYLPNRAACRAMAAAFLRASGGRAVLLPRLRPLGSAEEDALLLLTEEDETADAPSLPFPPAMGALERRMVLTQLILAWARQLRQAHTGVTLTNIAATPAAAAELALDLMRLMDEAETEAVDLHKIRELMPERFAEHEQLALSFLDIVVNVWPGYLAERGLMNPIDRRNRIMALEVERLRATRPTAPVIVAGSTGSIPATAALMQTVLDLPNGALVLPGVDLALDDAGWRAVAEHPEHPQAGFHQLLTGLRASRADVAAVREGDGLGAPPARGRFLTEALRPSSTIGQWPHYIATADTASLRASFANVTRIDAPTEQDEAAAIALIMREAAEVPGKTATLVTPDATLARRVSAELGRWGLEIAASATEPLRVTTAGIFYDLIADAAATGSQIALLGVLKHPFMRLGLPDTQVQAGVRVLEIAGLRQAWCGEGLDALSRSLHLAQNARPRHHSIDVLTEEEWTAAAELLHRLKEAMWPLTQLERAGALPFAQFAKAHAEAAAAIARDETGDCPALTADAHTVAMAKFMALLTVETPAPSLTLADYPALFRSLIRPERTRPTPATHPRLQILSPAEARLAAADLVILGGLNEGTWPEPADAGPWLNRSMRAALALPPPERRTRVATHDFWQLMGAAEVVLTRALKSEGTPTVPSRWLMRVETLLQGCGLGGILEPRRPWLEWAAARNTAPERTPIRPPAPRPPLAARPRTLSVSAVETLIANPYAIYARIILGLSPLEPLESEPDGDERGRIIHETLHLFARRFEGPLPPDPVGTLMTIFDERAQLFSDRARVRAFWRPRLERFARWFGETEAARRNGAQVYSEVRGDVTIGLPGGDFTLTARADRIDLRPDGMLAIYDYKSGGMPTENAVANFKSPQLPLEALIATEGYFRGLGRREVAKLAFISARGGEPAGDERVLEKQTPAALAQGAREGLVALVNRFDLEETPYAAMRRAAFSETYKFDTYAHLARVAEWAGASEEDR